MFTMQPMKAPTQFSTGGGGPLAAKKPSKPLMPMQPGIPGPPSMPNVGVPGPLQPQQPQQQFNELNKKWAQRFQQPGQNIDRTWSQAGGWETREHVPTGGPTLQDRYTNALFGDRQTEQGLIDKNFKRDSAAIKGIGDTAQWGAQQSLLQGEKSAQSILGAVPGFDKQIKSNEDVLSGMDQRYEKGIKEFQDTSAKSVASATLGASQQLESMYQQAVGGVNPDGTMMTPEQKAAMQHEFGMRKQQTVSQIATELGNKINEQRLSARMNQAHDYGAVGVQIGQTNSELRKAQMDSIGMAENFRQAGLLNAMQYAMGGAQAVYQAFKETPFSAVGLADTIAALFQSGAAGMVRYAGGHMDLFTG